MSKDSKEESIGIESDLVSLARLAASESLEDTRLFLARLIRKYRQSHPELASRLDQSLKSTQARSSGNSVLRRGTSADESSEAALPVDGDSRLALIRVFDDREELASPILPNSVHEAIGAIIRERQESQLLAARAGRRQDGERDLRKQVPRGLARYPGEVGACSSVQPDRKNGDCPVVTLCE